MTIQEAWQQAQSFLGQPVEVEDSSALDQCMDWAFKICDILGIDRTAIRHGYAYQVWKQPNDLTVKYFEFIPNTPNGVPQQLDIPIFDQNIPGVTGIAGHICAATGEGNSNSFWSLDENWNGVQKIQKVQHSYTGVLGWLRPKSLVPTPVDVSGDLAKCNLQKDEYYNDWQESLHVISQLHDQLNTATKPETITVTVPDPTVQADLDKKNAILNQIVTIYAKGFWWTKVSQTNAVLVSAGLKANK